MSAPAAFERRLNRLLGWQLLEGYAAGRWSPSDAMEALLTAATTSGESLGAFTHVARREATQAAQRIERRPLAGALAALPVSVKDDLCPPMKVPQYVDCAAQAPSCSERRTCLSPR